MKKHLPVLLLALAVLGFQEQATEVVSPSKFLGFEVGADRRLADWTEIVSYFRKLDEASDRVLVQELGRTTEDNPFILAVISAPKTLAELESYREIQKLLADPRKLENEPPGRLEELIRRGKTMVVITCTIHSTEVAAAQASMEFAHHLAVSSDAETQEILAHVIFLLVPSLNPDGVNKVTHWYRQTLGTPAEGTSPPELYHRYVGHDNNRDWYMFTQKETRLAVEKIHNVWHPQIVYDVHQMGATGARIFVPPFIDPIDANVDPILQAQIAGIGASMFSALVTAGKTGVVTNAIYDAYTPARAYQHYHGGVRLLTEAASARLATPLEIRPEELAAGRNYDARVSSWNFPAPWPGGVWRLRDIIEYEKIAFQACLLHAARYRESWLRNFYQVGLNAIRRNRPYAFVLPPDQRDRQSLVDLLQVLEFGLVEIHRAGEAFSVRTSRCVSRPLGQEGRRNFPAGSYVVRMNQPYSSFAKTMLEIQRYPELREFPGGPLERPYDVTAHTLGIQMGVEVYEVDEPFEVPVNRLEKVQPTAGQTIGSGEYFLYSHTHNAFARLTNRLLKKGHAVFWAPNGFQVDGEGFPVGTLMARGTGLETDLKPFLSDLPLEVRRLKSWPQLAWQRIRAPRIGLYRSYVPSMDEGWTRWILEGYEFPYTTVLDSDIRGGDLSRFEVLVFADQSPRAIKNGAPLNYPERYRGGLGAEGLARLKQFAERGGTLLFLGEATRLPIEEWDLGTREITAALSAREFYVPGAFLRVKVHNRHPIGYGMPEEAAVMFVESQAFESSQAVTVAAYPSEDLLLSGWADGRQHLFGKSALVEVALGQGRIILIGFRTQFRAQARGTYKFLFNSLYYATTESQ